jgi:hypothetical protein
MSEMKIHVPTYNHGALVQGAKTDGKPEFGDPYVPLVIRRADGVRILLGSHDYYDPSKPDIQIERRPHGWVIFLHPVGGGDPSGHIYFLDDGRSFLVPERSLGTTPPINALEWDETVPEIDNVNEDK